MRYHLFGRLARSIYHEDAGHYDRETVKLVKHLRVSSARRLGRSIRRGWYICRVRLFKRTGHDQSLASALCYACQYIHRGLEFAPKRRHNERKFALSLSVRAEVPYQISTNSTESGTRRLLIS